MEREKWSVNPALPMAMCMLTLEQSPARRQRVSQACLRNVKEAPFFFFLYHTVINTLKNCDKIYISLATLFLSILWSWY